MSSKATSTPTERLLARLKGVQPRGQSWSAKCPAHDDANNSLSIKNGEDGRALIHCFAGCMETEVARAVGLKMRDLFPRRHMGSCTSPGDRKPPETCEILKSSEALTLADYAAARQLPAEFLAGLGLTTASYFGRRAVRVPYYDASRTEMATRFRLAMKGPDRFRWKRNSKTCLYGLWRLPAARKAGYVVLVEGESDCHTLWWHGVPALGVPGASSWKQGWVGLFDGIATIYVVVEPDQGGQNLLRHLAGSTLRDRLRVIHMEGAKDPSDLHMAGPDSFEAAWKTALAGAVLLEAHDDEHNTARRAAAWEFCQPLATQRSILDCFWVDLQASGVVGEERAAKLTFLALVTRFLPRPVSCVVKGPSSAGKSHLVKSVLEFFPPSAYFELTAMSERPLFYSEEPLSHRFLVVYEAPGMQAEMVNYAIRSLLSEGRLRYETVERTTDGPRARLLEREGPTGLLVTTTAWRL